MTWIWLLLTVGIVANGLRLRRRVTAIRIAEPSMRPADPEHRFITAAGVELDEEARRSASEFARREGLEVLDLVPGDLPVERALELVRLIDPRTYRHDRLVYGRSAGHAILAHTDVVRRAGLEKTSGLDPVAFLKAAILTKRYACVTSDLAILPGLGAAPQDTAKRLAYLRAIFAGVTPAVLAIALVQYIVLLAGPLVRPLWGIAALAAFSLQPLLVLAGTEVRSRDLAWLPPVRPAVALWTWLRVVTGRWRPAGEGDPCESRRAEYVRRLEGGTERFFEPRRQDCPLCGSEDLVAMLRTGDRFQCKPGEFTLEQCHGCEHIFQNPRLTVEGLDFYYKDFYDGLWSEQLEFIFSSGGKSYLGRARMLEGLAQPQRWLDVGTGYGHFCCLARDVWPTTHFDGLDIGESVEEAARRRWIDSGIRGMFPALAPALAGAYDVVSMHHYLEHTRQPLEEIEAARTVLSPGGHLLIEVPNPECGLGRFLGARWLPWFQPQHQHFFTVRNLERALRERGFTLLVEQRGEAHQPVDLASAVFLTLNRLAPPTDLPWRPRASVLSRLRRRIVFAAGFPLLVLAWLADIAAAPLIQRVNVSNTFRVLARKEA